MLPASTGAALPRPASIWLRASDKHFYVTIGGKKLKLSPDKKEATRLFHELMAKEAEPAGSTVSPSFKRIADLYLDDCLRTRKPNTYRVNRYNLQNFCDHVGPKRVADLRVHHVTAWVGEHQRPSRPGEMTKNGRNMKTRMPWNESTACTGRTSLLSCLNWAVAQGYIEKHPLAKLKRGSHRRRERYLTPEERARIKAQVKPDFADFLTALELTGARPFSEMATLTAASINWAASTVTLVVHKNAGKGKSRTIYVSPALAVLLKRKSEEYPTGPLFRNRWGTAWRSHDATRRMHFATRKLGIPRVVPYDYRHSFITDALAKGLSANLIGELVGNSPIVIARNYSHLHQQPATMLEAAARAVG